MKTIKKEELQVVKYLCKNKVISTIWGIAFFIGIIAGAIIFRSLESILSHSAHAAQAAIAMPIVVVLLVLFLKFGLREYLEETDAVKKIVCVGEEMLGEKEQEQNEPKSARSNT